MKWIPFIALGLLLSPGLASGATATYRAWRYPRVAPTCIDAAAQVAAAFRQHTGIREATGNCDWETYDGYDISVEYEAPARLVLVSTSDEYGRHQPQGTYPNRGACEAGIVSEKSLFREKTSLTAFIAYCYPESSYGPSEVANPYVLRIDAFGTPLLWSHTAVGTFSGRPVVSAREAAREFLAEARRRGVDASLALLDHVGYNSRLMLKYYGAERLPLQFREFGRFETADECQRQMPSVKSVYARFQSEPWTLVCAYSDIGYAFRLYGFYAKLTYFAEETVTWLQYPTIAECESDRARILQLYREQRTANAAAALCDGISQSVRMRVFLLP